MTIRSLAAPLALAVSLVAGQAAAADLVLTMTGGGNATPGQTKTFTINTSSAALGVPPGLEIKVELDSDLITGISASNFSLSGPGWTCDNVEFYQCTRTSGVAAGSPLPPITLTVEVESGPGPYSMCFEVSHGVNAGTQPDQNTGNNRACVNGNISAALGRAQRLDRGTNTR